MAQAQDWFAVNAPKPAAAPVSQDWFAVNAPAADFSTANATDEQGSPLVRGLKSAYQASPFNIPAAFEFLKHAEANPESVVVDFLKSQGGQFVKAWDDIKSNRPFDAATHVLYGLTPGIGPALDAAKEQDASGDRAGAIGTVIGALSNLAIPEAMKALPDFKLPSMGGPANAVDAASNAFARQRDVPLDTATASGSKHALALQKRVANSIGGEGTAERLIGQQQQALTRVGGDLASDASSRAVTPEQAGQGIRDTLTAKADAHKALADASYERLRQLEADPAYSMQVPTAKAPVDALDPKAVGQLRRIVHEMDAAPYEPYRLRQADKGGSMEHVEGTGGAGAKVFDDIAERLDRSTNPTRSTMQASLEDFLGGGKESDTVRAAIKVAEERSKGKGGRTVSLPEMPPSAMDVPTRLEKTRVTSQDMGLPVDMAQAKSALQPVYDQMIRQMPVTQRDANPGLLAIKNILDGPDHAPLSQVDRDLSTIKSLARSQGGLAKYAAAKLEGAVTRAAANGGDAVVQPLKQGRAAVAAQYATQDLIDSLPGGKMEEPLSVFKRATAPRDAGISFLRQVKEHTPQVLPQIARAKLDELLSIATENGKFEHAGKLYAEWHKLGSETKRMLFPQAGQAQSLDNFFLLAKRIAENPNPSGTAHVNNAFNWFSTVASYPLAKMLYTPKGVQALTNGASLALAKASPAAQAASTARILSIARDLETALPKAAQGPEPNARGGSQ